MTKSELKKKYNAIHRTISEILWIDWDPIGINDLAPRDEYDDYVPEICSLVMRNKSAIEIANRLFQIETDTIGVLGNREHCLKVANKIIDEINRNTAPQQRI
ncbi:MAG: hypothetical protein HOH06_00550 [Polaribacter sp.]|jgi:hypothetical protein|nr:hypothetical protein [Polaribacter sp.]